MSSAATIALIAYNLALASLCLIVEVVANAALGGRR